MTVCAQTLGLLLLKTQHVTRKEIDILEEIPKREKKVDYLFW